MHLLRSSLCLALASISAFSARADLTAEQQQIPIEKTSADAGSAARVVLLAGSPSNKPGQHEYFAGCALLMRWLGAIPGVDPVLVADGWPKNESVLDGARCVVCYMDGGAKLAFLEPSRWARMKALADGGAGLVVLHQTVDVPEDHADEFRSWFGAVWQKDIGCRGHWDVTFESVPQHPVLAGVKPFTLVKDGWLYNLHYAQTGVTPLLSAQMPETSRSTADAKAHAGRAETVAWAFERPGAKGGRSMGFTGCDLHANWQDENQRRLVLNGILWAARVDVPGAGAASACSEEDLKHNLDRKIFTPKKPASKAR